MTETQHSLWLICLLPITNTATSKCSRLHHFLCPVTTWPNVTLSLTLLPFPYLVVLGSLHWPYLEMRLHVICKRRLHSFLSSTRAGRTALLLGDKSCQIRPGGCPGQFLHGYLCTATPQARRYILHAWTRANCLAKSETAHELKSSFNRSPTSESRVIELYFHLRQIIHSCCT